MQPSDSRRSALGGLDSPVGQPRERASPNGCWRDVLVDARAGQHPAIRVRCHEPSLAEHGVLVWAHGGSWVTGSVESWHEPCAALAAASGLTVLSVDYRLAPRWRHPAPLQDVLRVLRWAARHYGAGDGGPPLSVGGDSAGGTIAAAVALRCREDGPALAAQVLAYPPLDPACAQPSYRRWPGAFPTRAAMLDAWRSHLGSAPLDPGAPAVTPWSVHDLRGLPPTIIGFGENDPVADDSRRFAERLTLSGNQVTLREFPRAGHGLFLRQRADGSFPLQEWLGRSLAALPARQATSSTHPTTIDERPRR